MGHRDGQRLANRILHEADVLTSLEGAELPIPRLLASDPNGQASGGFPALVMTKMPGRVFLTPANPDSWLKQMAVTLARIHSVKVGLTADQQPIRKTEHPTFDWAIRPELWEEAMAVIDGPPPALEPGFLHGDYQHFNMVWSRERLTGVLDWPSGSVGPQDADLGHCRLNLAVLYSADWADRFRLAYESEAGRTVEPWWDLFEILQYSPDWEQFIPIQVAGRAAVDAQGMTGRVEELIRSILRRI
jgi:aminoglycoside phosphotransferase (APT) family kinase protein